MCSPSPVLTVCAACSLFFFFNDTATTEIYTLSLHDALPISCCSSRGVKSCSLTAQPLPEKLVRRPRHDACCPAKVFLRSEEHTSELQSQSNLVCRLLLEKKKNHFNHVAHTHNNAIRATRSLV